MTLEAWSQMATIISAIIALISAIIATFAVIFAYKTFRQFKIDGMINRAQDIFSDYLRLGIEFNDKLADKKTFDRMISYKLYALEEIYSLCTRRNKGGIIRRIFLNRFTAVHQ